MLGATFADLCCGIGTARIGFESAGFRTTAASEIDEAAIRVYEDCFGTVPSPRFDLRRLKRLSSGVLHAGLPCQAFSTAGAQRGLADPRGGLVNDFAGLVKRSRPDAFLVENVPAAEAALTRALGRTGYPLASQVLNASDYGLAQNRRRLFIVGIRRGTEDWRWPEPTAPKRRLRDVLEAAPPATATFHVSERYANWMKRHRERHRAKGNGYGYIVPNPDGLANTIVCGGMGRERNLVECPESPSGLRTLTTTEVCRLQGITGRLADLLVAMPKTRAWRLIAQAEPIPVVAALAKSLR